MEDALAAALDLFAEHGVSGTSLQMIADHMGVTKAAVYHQFKTKEDIVSAVIDPILERVILIAHEAARQATDQRRARYALAGIVDLVVEHRRLAAIVQFDPVVAVLVQGHRAHTSFEQIQALFTGPDPDAERLVGAAMVSGGLMMAGIRPALASLSDDDPLRHLVASARRLLR